MSFGGARKENSGGKCPKQITLFSADLFVIIFSFFGAEEAKSIISCWLALRTCRVALPRDSSLWKTVMHNMMQVNDKKNSRLNRANAFYSDDLKLELNILIERVQFNFLQNKESPNYIYLLFLLCSPTKCSRSGCGRYFREIDNLSDSCSFHPGKIRGVRTLSCCREPSFSTPGCKRDRHDGEYFRFVYSSRHNSGGGSTKASECSNSNSNRGTDDGKLVPFNSVTVDTSPVLPQLLPALTTIPSTISSITGGAVARDKAITSTTANTSAVAGDSDLLMKLPSIAI